MDHENRGSEVSMITVKARSPRVIPPRFDYAGVGLVGPDCVLTTASGDLISCDARAAIAITSVTGRSTLLGSTSLSAYGIVVAGIAIRSDGAFVLANRGVSGGVWVMNGAGEIEPLAIEALDGPVPAIGAIATDVFGGLWATTTSPASAFEEKYRVCDRHDDSGCIFRIDSSGIRVTARGLRAPGQICIEGDGKHLLVAEEGGRRILRFRIADRGELSDREEVMRFERDIWPVGIALDQDHGIWITSTMSGRVIRLGGSGDAQTILQDCSESEVADVEEAWRKDRMIPAFTRRLARQSLGGVAGIAFGGTDLRKIVLGSVTQGRCAAFCSPVPGVAPLHWCAKTPPINYGLFAKLAISESC
jgi:hypothetical protein